MALTTDQRILKLALFGLPAADISDLLAVSVSGDVQRVVGASATDTTQRVVDLLAAGHGVDNIIELMGPRTVSAGQVRTIVRSSDLPSGPIP